MLSRDPADRGTPKQLMKESWFNGFDFDQLLCKAIVPKYVPQLQRVDDRTPLNGTVEQIMAREEVVNGGASRRSKKPAPEGWDKDF